MIDQQAKNSVVESIGLYKTFHDGKIFVEVLRDINLSIAEGEQVAIIGVSGAGKSTLLHILGGLDKPTKGQVVINGSKIHELGERERSRLRNQTLGFVYQFHHLLPEFTVLENVCMPLLIRKMKIADAKANAEAILEKIGLTKRMHHKLGELSGGERQRTAIARALVTKPKCLFADEPTGNLDYKTSDKVYETMMELNRELKTSLVIVTHDMRLATNMDRVLTIENGTLVTVK